MKSSPIGRFGGAAGRVLALAGTVALVASACGSSHHAATTTSTTAGSTGTIGSAGTVAPGTQGTGTPYTVGVISSDSGAAGTTADISTTVHNWVTYTNSHGGINGHPVKLVYFDDQDSSANAAADASTLIQDHVLAVMDSSFVNNAFEKAVDAAKIPVISLTGSGQSFLYLTDANFFADSTTVLATVYAQPYTAKLAGATSIAYLYCAEDPNCAQAVPLAKADAKSLGVNLNYSAAISSAAPNYTAQCLAAKAAGSQAMFIAAASPAAIARVAANCASQGYNPIQVTASGTIADSFLTQPGFGQVIGEVNTFPVFLNSSPATQVFHQVMDSYLPKALRPVTVSAAWTGMELFKAAAVNAGDSPTAQSIYTGLYGVNGTLGGLAPTLSFKQGQPNPVNCFYEVKSQGGKYTAPNGDTPTCVTPPPIG